MDVQQEDKRMDTKPHVHVSPMSMYLAVFAALMVLTALTAWVSFQDLGRWNDVVALSIATTKMTLVIVFFMHVKYSTRLTKLVVLSGFLWLLILLGLTFADYVTRGVVGFR
jgi:cytochrome c oxidase subunit 4